ncbi:hypothetical protein [Paraburkholderia hayleyella]|uniref:hypothetical protein n=1 Tax=Paraburkholderia hayleyella TaxID=2152889 RepID=UPI0012921586|nr:hypothetical protein [Paraburkholderia hayleyella]
MAESIEVIEVIESIKPVDTPAWPIVQLHRPEPVPDAQAEALLVQIEALDARGEPFALRMSNAIELQRRGCIRAVRIEADAATRGAFEVRMRARAKSVKPPHPYAIVATDAQAVAHAQAWLAHRNAS